MEEIYDGHQCIGIREINRFIPNEKYSLLVLNTENLNINRESGEKNELIVMSVYNTKFQDNLFEHLPSSLIKPNCKYKKITDDKTFIVFETSSIKSLKDIVKENQSGLEESVKKKDIIS